MSKLAPLPGHVSAPDPSIYWSDNYVTVDFETTTILKGSPLSPENRIVLACWTYLGVAKHCFGSEFDMGELVADIEASDFIVAHNAKFELGWLRRCGVDLRKIVVYDTLIGEYVRGGNRFNLVMLGLDACLKRYRLNPKVSICGLMLKAGIDTTLIPESWLLKYCYRDVAGTEELFLQQREILKDRGLIHIQYQRCLVTPALVDMEFHGMQLDDKMVHNKIKIEEDAYAKKTEELQRFMGGVPPSATLQKGVYIYTTLGFKVPRDYKGNQFLTKSGNGSTAADVLLRLKATTPKQIEFLKLHTEWAALHSDVTKYLRKFEQCCNEAAGLMRAIFNQCVSRTHRLTSSGFEFKVQFQNLNRSFKPVFTSRHEGWLMGEIDGAQLEFRIAAHLGRDKQAYEDITGGVDIHRYTASVLHEIPEEEVTREQRQAAKPDTFKPTYGGKSGTPAQERYYAAFAAKYHQLHAAQTEWTHQVLKDKKLTTEYGLIYYWPECRMTRNGYIIHSTNIFNYPVQGLATAEIIPIGLVCAWHRMRDMESFLVNTVHDSIVGEIHPDEEKLWHELGRTCFIDDTYTVLHSLYGVDLTVPLGAGVMVGSHWANKEAKASETVYEADPDHYIEAAHNGGMI